MLDEHTPCVGCATPVQEVFSRAVAVVAAHDRARGEAEPHPLIASLAAALNRLRPHIEAHFANQLHAYSEELAPARRAETEEQLELTGALPFTG
jgi:hypothetical protein